MITSWVPFSRACSVCFTPVTETAILGLSTDGSGPPSPRDLLGFLIFDFDPGTSVVPSVDPGGPRRLPAEDAMLKIYWGLNLGAGTRFTREALPFKPSHLVALPIKLFVNKLSEFRGKSNQICAIWYEITDIHFPLGPRDQKVPLITHSLIHHISIGMTYWVCTLGFDNVFKTNEVMIGIRWKC